MYDIIVIGGGIVGLATALRILEQRPSTKLCILEKENQVAKHQTGNNSGVIHSGIYYKPNSLKAINCVRGYQMMLDFCRENEIPFDLCGKIIVATSKEELPALQNIYQRGVENGLTGIKKINAQEIKENEPYCAGIEGIFVPQTGIIDYKVVSQKMAQRIQEKGGAIFFQQKVVDIQLSTKHAKVFTTSTHYEAKLVVNCCGLYSDKIAALTQKNLNIRIIPFRGEYYKIKDNKKHLVRNLIYPVPNPNFPFLGVHFTRMMNGAVEAGPNAVLAYQREGYSKSQINWSELVESLTWGGFQKVAFKYWQTGLGELYRSYSKAAFTKALQKLIPDLKENDLTDGGAGVRAQACDKNGGLIDDFLILEDQHTINVCNAPSPAATSSLSIGQSISEMVLKRF